MPCGPVPLDLALKVCGLVLLMSSLFLVFNRITMFKVFVRVISHCNYIAVDAWCCGLLGCILCHGNKNANTQIKFLYSVPTDF